MEEISVSQLHELFSDFIQRVYELKDDLNSALDFQMGSSSSFSFLVDSITSKIVPIIESLTKEYISLYQDNVRISSQYESELQKSDLYQNAYSEVSSFLTQTKNDCNYLWSVTAAFAALLLQSDTENINLRNQLITAKERLKYNKTIIEDLQNQVYSMKKNEDWILKNFEDIFTAPDLLINAKEAVQDLNNSLHDEKEAKIKELENEISEFKTLLEQAIADSNSKQEQQQIEIDNLKNQNQTLNETIEKNSITNQNLEKTINELNDKISYLNDEDAKKEKMEAAIKNFCDSFPFITYNGENFDYNVEDVSKQLVLEKTLLSTRKENKDLLNQINDLKEESRKAKINYEKSLLSNRNSLSYEINELKLRLKQSSELRDNAIFEMTQLKSKINQLNTEKIENQKKIKEINDKNQELLSKYNEIKSHEDSQLSLYEESLKQLNEIVIGDKASKTTSKSNLGSKSNSDSSFINSLIFSDSNFSIPLENTPEAVIFKEANETLQKENDSLKQEKNNLSNEIKNLKNEIQRIQENNTELSNELSEAKNKIISTENSVIEWQKLYEKFVLTNKQTDPAEDNKIMELDRKLKESLLNSAQLQKQLNEITEKLDEEKQKYQELKTQDTEQIDKLQNKILHKDSELIEANLRLNNLKEKYDEISTNSNSQIADAEIMIAEKDKEIQNLRTENEELQKHVNLLETHIEEKQRQNQTQTSNLNSQNNIEYEDIPDEYRPTPPPEIEEPEIRETHDVDIVELDDEQDTEQQIQEDDVDNALRDDSMNEENENITKTQNDDTNEEDVEQEQENKFVFKLPQEQSEKELTTNLQQEQPEKDFIFRPPKDQQENEKEIASKPQQEQTEKETISKPQQQASSTITNETQHQHQYQQDRNRDKGRDRTQGYMKRSQSVASDNKSYYQQNKRPPANNSNTNNNQKTKGPPDRRGGYQKRSNTKRKK